MKQEELLFRDLLFRDLSARLPYKVKVLCSRLFKDVPLTLIGIDGTSDGFYAICKKYNGSVFNVPLAYCVPYLRPMASMTEEEEEEYERIIRSSLTTHLDWLLERHFDFRDLIVNKLAIKVTEENNPYVREIH